jgi:hypothetical protein
MSKIRKSARGEDCQVRLNGVCNFNSETTIFAHKSGAGMGLKSNDIHGAYCCSSCHDVIDGRGKVDWNKKQEIENAFYEGIFRTQLLLLEKGLIKIM